MPAPPTLLITGFEPFAHYAVNPSWHAASAAAGRFGGRVAAVLLPVDYYAARAGLLATLADLRPWACLCTGLAAGDVFRFEASARKPPQFADTDGPDVIAGTWPWDDVERRMHVGGVPCRASDDAGRYVCEATYWSLLVARAGDPAAGPSGFLHVPAESVLFPVERTTACVTDAVAAFLEAADARAPSPGHAG